MYTLANAQCSAPGQPNRRANLGHQAKEKNKCAGVTEGYIVRGCGNLRRKFRLIVFDWKRSPMKTSLKPLWILTFIAALALALPNALRGDDDKVAKKKDNSSSTSNSSGGSKTSSKPDSSGSKGSSGSGGGSSSGSSPSRSGSGGSSGSSTAKKQAEAASKSSPGKGAPNSDTNFDGSKPRN